jgi:tetratricopeptide (TPR) repeat protein
MTSQGSPAEDKLLQAKYEEYRSMWSTDPSDRIWAAVAEAFDLTGDGQRTIAAREKAASLNPEWGRHQLELAKAFIRARQWTKALKALDTCADLDGSGCDSSFYAENVLYYLGYTLFAMARYKEAAEAWRGADNVIQFWRSPEPLKEFHLHRGWAHHLEKDLLSAIEAYRRAMVAPGPGDTSLDDEMDTDQVERAQAMNTRVEFYMEKARAGVFPDADTLDAVPYTV